MDSLSAAIVAVNSSITSLTEPLNSADHECVCSRTCDERGQCQRCTRPKYASAGNPPLLQGALRDDYTKKQVLWRRPYKTILVVVI